MKKAISIILAATAILISAVSCTKNITCKCIVDMGEYGKSESTIEVEGKSCSEGNSTTTTTAAGMTVTVKTTCEKI